MSGVFNPPRALQVPFNPAGNIASTNVQTMGEELDAEKVAKSGDTMTGGLDISYGGLSIKFGADSNSSTRTNNTNKFGRISSPPYALANLDATVFSIFNDSTRNILQFGGSSSLMNAATEIRFYTAANNTTPVGTEIVRISSSGEFQMYGANTVIDSNRNHVFRRYTVGTVPAAASNAGRGVMVTPTSGNERLYTSNGTNWYDGAGVILS